MKRLIASVVLLGLFVVVGTSCCAGRQDRRAEPVAPEVTPRAAEPDEKVDLTPKALDRIPVGTVIGAARRRVGPTWFCSPSRR